MEMNAHPCVARIIRRLDVSWVELGPVGDVWSVLAHAPVSCSTQKAALTHGEPLSAAMLTFSYVLATDLN
jgi:hypothetical protein